MHDETRSQSAVIVDLLRATNGGAVSVELIRAVLWHPIYYPCPDDWIGCINSLMRTARFRMRVDIERVKSGPFFGYRLVGARVSAVVVAKHPTIPAYMAAADRGLASLVAQ